MRRLTSIPVVALLCAVVPFPSGGPAQDVSAIALHAAPGSEDLLPTTHASRLDPPGVVPRSGWRADESLRFRRGRERGARGFSPASKLIVHHTATPTWDAGPAAVRAIYRYHTMVRGYADIAYHYLIAPDGRIFKGRYSGPRGTRVRDRVTPDKARGGAVTGAHTYGANDGTIGVALLGNFERRPLPEPARDALVRLLAWLSDRYGVDPLGASTYRSARGPVTSRNITGHGTYGDTDCPGAEVARELPAIRHEVAERVLAADVGPDLRPPVVAAVDLDRTGRRGFDVRWSTNEPSAGVVRYRTEDRGRWRTVALPDPSTEHAAHIGGLRRDTWYVVRLGATDAAGNGRVSAPQLVRTSR